jgi:ligand-binding sensor domain-containing protein
MAVLAGVLISAGARAQVPPSHPPVALSGASATQQEAKMAANAATKFTHFRVGSKNVKSIFVDGALVWVGTSGGLVRYDTRDDSYKLFDGKSGLLSNGVFYVGRINGRLTVGTYGGGLSFLDERSGKWNNYNIPEGLGDAFVYDVVAAKNGDVWIATWSGVNRVIGGAFDDRSKWHLYTVENTKGGLPNDWVYGLAEGRNGVIWLATEGGMARFAKGRWDNWNHSRGLGAPYEKVKDSIEFKNDPGRASSHHAKQKEEMGLSNVDVAFNPNYVIALEIDRNGDVWAGTWGGGLSRYDGKRWVSYTTSDGLPGNHIFMLHLGVDGKLWIGTNSGLVTWQNEKFSKPLTVADGLFANNVFAMASSAADDLWVGSYGGVAHLRLGK